MIHLRGASFVYQAPDGEVEALRQVDMDIAPGEFCSVVGPSGCGKSTLLSVISGLERLTSGTVEVDGAAVCGPSDKIGLMPQRDQLFPWRTIRDNVTLGLSVLGKRTPENLAYADTLLRRYGLWDFARKRPAQLSGGMARRLALARCLALGGRLCLMDEPFSALDSYLKWQVELELADLLDQFSVGRTHAVPELDSDLVTVICCSCFCASLCCLGVLCLCCCSISRFCGTAASS